jgi:nucleotide-binding universal stress UspA family protein
MPVVIAQARAFGAEVILLHVLPPRERALAETVTPAEAAARAYLDTIAAHLRAEGLCARTLVRAGPAADTILDEITAQRADLLVLGSTTRHALTRRLLGSVAEAVIARGPCPILLVRPPEGRAARPPAVRSFAEDAARAGPVAPREMGIRTVEIARIIGSVGRAGDLDATFRSRVRRGEDDGRFERILALMRDGVTLPPVALYKLGYGYYVLDGTHRVAAARQLGQLEIEAQVTEFVPLGDPQAQRVAVERRSFEQATGLRRIGVVTPGHYPRLENMIRDFAREHGIDDVLEAARRWDTQIYQPIAAKIRRRGLSQRVPGARTADIFIQLAADRADFARREGRELSWDDAIKRRKRAPGGPSI